MAVAALATRTLIIAIALFGCMDAGHAEVQVTGAAGDLRVSADGDKLSDVLSSLSSHLRVKFRSTVNLDATISGAYSGSLGQVMSRLLVGYNYVIKQTGDQREIIVLGARSPATIPPPAAAGPPSVASRWR